MMSYGDEWRRNRRSFYRYFNANAMKKYRPNQLTEARKLAISWLAKPDKFAEVLRQ
jgi:cytochrome P450